MIRILIVDDEPLVRSFLREKIPTLNHDCEIARCCGDGQEALDFLIQAVPPVDLVFTDIKMPVMDGLEFSRRLRKQFPDILVVILSGFGDFDFAQQAIQYGVSDYILKPIVNLEFEQLLLKMVNQIETNKREKQEKQREKQLLTLLLKEQSVDKRNIPESITATEELTLENHDIVDAAIVYILKNYHKPISLSMVAEEIGVSVSYLSGLFHRRMGESYVKYLTRLRMEAAARYLDNYPLMPVADIAERTGHMTSKHFLYVFKKHFGITPTEYRRQKKADIFRQTTDP